MVARNDITGDKIQTRDKLTKEGEDNFDKIFGQKKKTNGGWKPPTDLAKPVVTPTQPVEYAEDCQDSQRDKAISQNGNVGYTTEQIEGEE